MSNSIKFKMYLVSLPNIHNLREHKKLNTILWSWVILVNVLPTVLSITAVPPDTFEFDQGGI